MDREHQAKQNPPGGESPNSGIGPLASALTMPGRKESVVADCVVLIDEEVASKRGLSAMAIKTGYKLVKGVKPGFVERVTEWLLPRFADALDPIWQQGCQMGDPKEHLRCRSNEAAEALLGVTDTRIEMANAPVRSTYSRLRGSAKDHVEAAIPRLALLIDKHVD